MQKDKKLLDILRDKTRVKHYSLKREKAYTYWVLYHDIKPLTKQSNNYAKKCYNVGWKKEMQEN